MEKNLQDSHNKTICEILRQVQVEDFNNYSVLDPYKE
jgi:hypothetical protein